MRTTLTIADDVLFVAQERAKVERRTVGEVVSELARTGLTSANHTSITVNPDDDAWLESEGIQLFPPREAVVTNADVNKLRDELFL